MLLHSAHADCSLVASLSDSQVEPWPAAHCVWSWQAERSLCWLNFMSASVQVSHSMSAVAEPPADLPWPAGQVDHAAHSVALPAASVKVSAGQPVQKESVVLSAETVRNWPAGHVTVLSAQVVKPLTPVLKSVASHDVHVASAALDAEAEKNSPAGQVVVLVAHDVTVLSPTLKSSASQAVHVASTLGEPAVKYSPAAHDAVRVWHGP